MKLKAAMAREGNDTMEETEEREDEDDDLIQATKIQLDNGYRFMGTYIGPQTRQYTVEKYLAHSPNDNSNNHFLCSDLNAKHFTWDRVCNEIGNAVHKVKNRIPNTYVIEENTPTYYKLVKKRGRHPDSTLQQSRYRHQQNTRHHSICGRVGL